MVLKTLHWACKINFHYWPWPLQFYKHVFSLGLECGSKAIVEDWRMRQVIVIKVTAFTMKIFSLRHSFNCVYYEYNSVNIYCICVFICRGRILILLVYNLKKKSLFSLLKVFFLFSFQGSSQTIVFLCPRDFGLLSGKQMLPEDGFIPFLFCFVLFWKTRSILGIHSLLRRRRKIRALAGWRGIGDGNRTGHKQAIPWVPQEEGGLGGFPKK